MRAINRNKIIAVMAAIVVFMVSMCTYSAETKATNTDRAYYVYDAQSGNYLKPRDYTLFAYDTYPNVNSGNARGIIDGEDRDVDWSKNGVVKTFGEYIDEEGNEQTSIGTGFIIGDHLIATAAHCVYNIARHEANEEVRVVIYNTDGTVAQTVNGVETHIPVNYSNAALYLGEYDYALITVAEDLSNYPKFELGVPLDSAVNSELGVKLSGFPGTVNNLPTNGEIYTGTGNLKDEYYDSETQICFTCDSSAGNSGGPVYVEESRNNYSYLTAIAIMTSGPDTYGVGTRMTTDLLHFYKNNPNISYE